MADQTPMVYGFTLNDIYEKPVSLSQFRGKGLLLEYLVDRSGKVVARYHHRTKPLVPEITQDVERVLAVH